MTISERNRRRPRRGGLRHHTVEHGNGKVLLLALALASSSSAAQFTSSDSSSSGAYFPLQAKAAISLPLHHYDHGRSRRRTDEVEKISQTECLFTTSLATENGGATFAVGHMFTVLPSAAIEILTLEFDAQIRAGSNMAAKVYYKEGDFSGATSNPELWTLLADTTAQTAPAGGGAGDEEAETGAIIPASDFTRVTLNAGQQYSFYLHMEGGNDVMKVKSADGLIGENVVSDKLGLLSLQRGVSLSDGPFPNAFSAPAEFSGRLHYKTTQECDSVRTSSIVELEFAINENPEADVMNDLSAAVQKAIDAVVILDPDLIKFDKFHSLEIVGANSGFMGRSEEKCPPEFELCSLVTTSVEFLHLPTITSGELWLEVLKNDLRIAESVVAQSDVETEYVGDPIIQMDFIITLSGVPAGTRMNTLQRRYFETVTSRFLDGVSENVPIYKTEIVDEVASEAGRRRRRNLLRGSSYLRKLEGEGAGLQVVTTISGSGSNPADIRGPILEAIGLNSEQYIQELSTQQLRPGEINEGNSGDMFAQLTGASVDVKPEDFSGAPQGPASGSNSAAADDANKNENVVWLWLCSLGVVVSLVWLGYRFYRDFFFVPKEETAKLTGDDHFAAARRPSFEAPTRRLSSDEAPSRRPSMEGPPRRPARSLSLDRLPQRSKSMDGLGSQSAHVPRNAPGRTKSAADNLMPHSAHVPRNVAGDTGRGLNPTKSMSLSMLRHPFPKKADLSVDEEKKAPSGGLPLNQAGQKRGIKPTRSLPEMPRRPKSDDRSVPNDASKHSRQSSSNDASKHFTQGSPASRATSQPLKKAEPNRGIRPFHSMPATKRSISPSSRSLPGIPTKKHPPKRQPSADLPRSSTHSVRSVPNLKPIKHAPTKQSTDALSNASGHSLNGKANLTVKKHPPKKESADGLSKSSGHTVKSLPNLAVKKRPPKRQSLDGLSTASGHSINSVPNTNAKKHLPKNQAGLRRGIQPSRSLPNPNQPAPRGKGSSHSSSYDNWSSSDEGDSQSSEESDFDEGAEIRPLSPKKSKKNIVPIRKSKSMPEDSESSEESDLEDYISNLAPTVLPKRVESRSPVKGIGDQTSTPTELDLTDEESSIDEPAPTEKAWQASTAKEVDLTDEELPFDEQIPAGKTPKKKKEKKHKHKHKEKKSKDELSKKTKSTSPSLEDAPQSLGGINFKVAKAERLDQTSKPGGLITSRSLPDISKPQVTLREMMKTDDEDDSSSSSSSSESMEDTTTRDGPPSTIVQTSKSGTTDIPDDLSEVSSITASIHSIKYSKKAELRREMENRAAATSNALDSSGSAAKDRLAKRRNQLRDLSAQPIAQMKTPEPSPRANPTRDPEGKVASTAAPPLDASLSVVKEKKLAKIRNHLRDVSAQPVDLSTMLMRPAHLRDTEDLKTEPLPKGRIQRSRSGDFGAVGKIKLPRTRSGELGTTTRQSANADMSSVNGSVTTTKSHHTHKSWQKLVQKGDPSKAAPNDLRAKNPVRGQIRRSRSDERLTPATIAGGAKNNLRPVNGLTTSAREPVRGQIRRTRSDERLVPLKLTTNPPPREAALAPPKPPIRGLKRASSDERRGTIAAHLSSILGEEENH